MRGMRARNAIVVFAFSLAGVAGAGAADMRVATNNGAYAGGVRAEQLVIFDVEPGVTVRPYWLAPWRHQHYFPRTGKKPRVGRRENLAARGSYRPAQTYRRYWSNAAFAFDPWLGPPPEFNMAPPPRQEPLLK
jgi:hypothetical protein